MLRKNRRSGPRVNAAAFESLETRRLLSTMTVNGTADADVINLDVGGGLVTVTINGGSPQVTSDALTTDVTINGLAGADVININETGSNAVTINGGTENDTVHIAATSHLLDDITDLIAVNGDAGTDTVSFHDESHTGVTSYSFTAGNKLARTGMSQVTFNTENVSLASGSGNDTYNVNGALSAALTVDGNGGSDFLDLISTTNESAAVTPSGTTTGSGTGTFGAQGFAFADITRVIAGDLGTVTVTTPNADDSLFVQNGSGTSTRISGTSGGTNITEVSFNSATTVILDMAANDAGGGSDSLDLSDGTQAMQLLRVINGTGNNTMLVHSGNYDLDVDVGATLGNTTDITVDLGAVTFHSQQNIRSLALRNSATVDFVGSGSQLVAQNVSVTSGQGTLTFASGQSGSVSTSFAIGSNATMFKAGAGGFAIVSPQSHGAGATLSVTDGTCNMTTDAGTVASRVLNVAVDDAQVSCFVTEHLNSVFVANGGVLSMQSNGSRVLVTNEVRTDFDLPGGRIDLNNNDMLVDYTTASEATIVRGLLHGGRNNGLWNGLGIMSATASQNALHNTTLGSMEATEFKSIYGPSAKFDNESLDNTAVLIKYTYYGDADFNGVVNFDDYSRLDNGFTNHKTGWLNGDFDDNGPVNFDDYSLIDQAFNTQGAPLRPAGTRTPSPTRLVGDVVQ